jgi:hypothetical protein
LLVAYESYGNCTGMGADVQIRVNIKALSLNARDLQIVTGDYPAPHVVPDNCVPISGQSRPALLGFMPGTDGELM